MPDGRFDNFTDLLQNFVTLLVTVCIVHHLELVDVHYNQRSAEILCLPLLDLFIQVVTGVQAGQAVPVRQIADLSMQTGIADSQSDVAGHRLQQTEAVIGEIMRLAVGQHNRAADLSAHIQRSCNHRLRIRCGHKPGRNTCGSAVF
ncbi:hypothetical protein D3C80_1561680 [compost metagenome]